MLWHLIIKLYSLVVRWLFVSRNDIKMQFFGVVGFKSSTLTVSCLSSLFVHQKRKTYSNFCVPCWLSHISGFQGPKNILPFFWPRVTNHDAKSKISEKWFLRSLIFYITFSWCSEVEAKTKKNFWRSYKDFGMCNM